MDCKKRPLVGHRKLTKFMLLDHIGQNFFPASRRIQILTNTTFCIKKCQLFLSAIISIKKGRVY